MDYVWLAAVLAFRAWFHCVRFNFRTDKSSLPAEARDDLGSSLPKRHREGKNFWDQTLPPSPLSKWDRQPWESRSIHQKAGAKLNRPGRWPIMASSFENRPPDG